MLSAGININSWDSEASRNTPIHWAACYGNKDMVQFLTGNHFVYTKYVYLIHVQITFIYNITNSLGCIQKIMLM